MSYLTEQNYPTINPDMSGFWWQPGQKYTPEITDMDIKMPELIKKMESSGWRLPNVSIRGPEIHGPSIDLARPMPDLPSIQPPSMNLTPPNLGGLPAPELPSVGGRLPDVKMPELPKIDLKGGTGNLPSIGMPSLPGIGLPSLPGVELPKLNLGDYGNLPLAGIGLDKGKLTYNPNPTELANMTQAIGGGMQQSSMPILKQLGSTLSNVGGTAGSILGGIGSVVNPILTTVGIANTVKEIMDWLSPTHQWTPAERAANLGVSIPIMNQVDQAMKERESPIISKLNKLGSAPRPEVVGATGLKQYYDKYNSIIGSLGYNPTALSDPKNSGARLNAWQAEANKIKGG